MMVGGAGCAEADGAPAHGAGAHVSHLAPRAGGAPVSRGALARGAPPGDLQGT